jgi:site-specific recombinase XerD
MVRACRSGDLFEAPPGRLRCVNKLLVPFIGRYFDKYRHLLLRPDSPQSALWLSSRHDTRLTDKYIAHLIRATTLSTVGVKVTPHLFRTSAASAAAVYGGDNPYLGSAVLHNADRRVTLEHYNRATSLTAAESFRQIIRQYEKT